VEHYLVPSDRRVGESHPDVSRIGCGHGPLSLVRIKVRAALLVPAPNVRNRPKPSPVVMITGLAPILRDVVCAVPMDARIASTSSARSVAAYRGHGWDQAGVSPGRNVPSVRW
jgi:hypothetical protein